MARNRAGLAHHREGYTTEKGCSKEHKPLIALGLQGVYNSPCTYVHAYMHMPHAFSRRSMMEEGRCL